MDIVFWLRSLGLGKYEAIFRENDIDETVRDAPQSRSSAHEKNSAGATNGSKVGVYMQGMKLDQTKIARRQLGTALALFIDGSWGNCIHDKGFADVGANRTW
jgi:hypothetical protein